MIRREEEGLSEISAEQDFVPEINAPSGKLLRALRFKNAEVLLWATIIQAATHSFRWVALKSFNERERFGNIFESFEKEKKLGDRWDRPPTPWPLLCELT